MKVRESNNEIVNMQINFMEKNVKLKDLLEYINIQISSSIKLAGYSSDPHFFRGKVDTLLDVKREIENLLNEKN